MLKFEEGLFWKIWLGGGCCFLNNRVFGYGGELDLNQGVTVSPSRRFVVRGLDGLP